MKVVSINHIPDGAATKSMQNLGAMIGLKPHISKSIVTMYPNLTLQKLTEQLGAVYHKDTKDLNLKEIEAFEFQWKIKTNRIPRIMIAEDCNENGKYGQEFRLILEKKFYDVRDAFELENEQVLFVTRQPKQLAPNKVEHWVRIISGSLDTSINTNYLKRGSKTKYLTNYQPEMSEIGFSKSFWNAEMHRNYISRHRIGDSVSGDFAKLKPVYMQHGGDLFTMPQIEKDLLDQIYLAFENSMLLGPGNFDDNGKVLITEEDGREIPMGVGLIPTIKKYCGQTRYFFLSDKVLREVISACVEKMENRTGNTIAVACNWRMYEQAQIVLDNLLKTRTHDAYFYSKDGKKIKVGAEYNAYEFAGNTIVFMHNDALTERYPEKGYGVFIDTNRYGEDCNVQMMTLKGMSLFKGSLLGMGGKGGGDNVENMGSTVHASRYEMMGYRGIKLANPYTSHILEENVGWYGSFIAPTPAPYTPPAPEPPLDN